MLALLLLPAALALDPGTIYDLDVDIELLDAEPIQTTLHDVRPGVLPGFWAEGAEGQRYRISIELVEVVLEGHEAVRFEILIEEDREQRRGRWESQVLTAPRITTVVGEEARLMIGTNVPLGADPVEHPPSVQLSLLLAEQPPEP